MEIPLLNEIIVIFGLSVAVNFVCLKLRLPTTFGFLATGILAGPHGLALVGATHEVEMMAEIGVILLLFTIGIEFSLQKLLQVRRTVVLGGGLQLFLTILLFSRLAPAGLGTDSAQSLFLGFLVALSSTAIVLKVMQEKAMVDAPHGRIALSVLIFQDIAVVPLMLLTPLLAGAGGMSESPLWMIGKAGGVIVLVGISAKWLVPVLLHKVAATRSRELFLLTILIICFGVAWLTQQIGLSLALGAFLAGLIISESEYSHQTMGSVLPFRDVFTGLFFVSIGMLLDINYLAAHPVLIGLLVIGVMAAKTLVVVAAVAALGYPLRTAFISGLALCQIGEFSFILSQTGIDHGLLTPDNYQLFLDVAVISMSIAPFVIALAPGVGEKVSRLPLPTRLLNGYFTEKEAAPDRITSLDGHLIIAGYGLCGLHVARAARVSDIPYVVIEMNPETVRRERMAGVPIFYGDASQETVLEYAVIDKARALVVAVPDPAATRRIIATARHLNPGLYIIVRTRYFNEMDGLLSLGANVVVPEEFETAVEIFTRVMAHYLVPKNDIERFVSRMRQGGYRMFRSLTAQDDRGVKPELHFADLDVSAIRLESGSPYETRTLAEIDLRKNHGVTVLVIERGEDIITNPGGETRLQADDILVVLGRREVMAGICANFQCPITETG